MIAQQLFSGPSVDWWALAPYLIVVGGALKLMVIGSLTSRWPKGLTAWVTVVIATVAAAAVVLNWRSIGTDGTSSLVNGALAHDRLAAFLHLAILVTTALVALLSDGVLRGTENDGPEIYTLLLAAAAGAMVMVAANELIVMFLGLETLSLAFYVLAASDRRRAESQESGLKYFLLGGLASAFFLYGIALLYGATRTTTLTTMIDRLRTVVTVERNDALLLAGLALLLIGFAFKVAAVPFHVWAPDVYQGAPTNVTAFMASVGKIAAFGAMLRVLVVALPFYRDDWRPVVWVLAVLSLVVGSGLAVVQTNVKRMLAYSSVSHAGFMLIGVEAAGHTAGEVFPTAGMRAVVMYLAVYAVLVVGSFAVVTIAGGAGSDINEFDGLGSRRPILAVGLTVVVLAQAGVPLTSGFVAKWGVIQAAVDEGSYWLAVLAMLAAVIGAFVYLRIMVSVWLRTPTAEVERESVPMLTGLVIGLAAAATIAVGVYPSLLLNLVDALPLTHR